MKTEHEVSGQLSVVSSASPLPCPFCGGPATMMRAMYGPRINAKHEPGCLLRANVFYDTDLSRWNKRPGEQTKKYSVTLTIREIRQLAEFAGLRIVKETPNPVTDGFDDEDTPITVEPCPEKGVLDDDKEIIRTRYIAYYEEYPGEGVIPLGPILSCVAAAEHRAGMPGEPAGGDACGTPEGKP